MNKTKLLHYQLVDKLRHVRRDIKKKVPSIPGLPYIYISPFFLLFGVFLAFPVLYTLYLSFFDYQGVASNLLFVINTGFVEVPIMSISNLKYVGLENYRRLLTDSVFHQSMYNTIYIFLIYVPVSIGLALMLALALNASFVRMKGIFRTLIIVPVSANIAAYSTIFILLLDSQFGLINYFLTSVGLNSIPWLTDPFWARMSIIGTHSWRWTGYKMIIILAGLQSIPQQLYEAAELDGATNWHKFRYITLPQLRPILLFCLVIATIGSFRIFAEPFIITGGGPQDATITIVMYIYRQAFVNFNLGYASALTYVLVGLVSIVSILQLKIGGED